jgi:anti-sigma regulatory factor (Ser/Thr protein kinase)
MPEMTQRPVFGGATPTPHQLFKLDVPPSLRDAHLVRKSFIAEMRGLSLDLTDDQFDEMVICTGELLANAVIHTGKPSTLAVTWTGRVVRVEVHDASDAIPTPCQAGESTESGRGLALIQALADRWGIIPPRAKRSPGSSTGKTVWFEMATRPEAAVVARTA